MAVVFEIVSLRNSLRVSPFVIIGLVVQLDSALKPVRLKDLFSPNTLFRFGDGSKTQFVSSIGDQIMNL